MGNLLLSKMTPERRNLILLQEHNIKTIRNCALVAVTKNIYTQQLLINQTLMFLMFV
jgi:hypothetical protein